MPRFKPFSSKGKWKDEPSANREAAVSFKGVSDVFVGADEVLVADIGNFRIVHLTRDLEFFGQETLLNHQPRGVLRLPTGELITTSTDEGKKGIYKNGIQIVDLSDIVVQSDPDGTDRSYDGGPGVRGIAYESGILLLACTQSVKAYDVDGNEIWSRDLPLAIIRSVVGAGDGTFFGTDERGRQIFRFDSDGDMQNWVPDSVVAPRGVEVGDDGRIYICDTGPDVVFIYGADDAPVGEYAGGAYPVACRSRNGQLYVADGAFPGSVFRTDL